MGNNTAPLGEVGQGETGKGTSGIYIKQVAQILGLSPSVIRAWEGERLITPGRSPSGYRIYDARHVEQLRFIRDLIQNEGLNAAGVRRLLDHDAAGTAVQSQPDGGVHERIQQMRKAQGRTLRELAAATGLSASAISAIERGVSAPSVRTLRRLADALDTTVPILLGTSPNQGSVVVHPHERRVVDLGIPGVRYETLFATQSALQSMMIDVEPGGGSPESYSHEGDEFLYLLRGELELTIDELDTYRLGAGDAVTFQSMRPHRWRNPGAEATSMLWVNTPPSF